MRAAAPASEPLIPSNPASTHIDQQRCVGEFGGDGLSGNDGVAAAARDLHTHLPPAEGREEPELSHAASWASPFSLLRQASTPMFALDSLAAIAAGNSDAQTAPVSEETQRQELRQHASARQVSADEMSGRPRGKRGSPVSEAAAPAPAPAAAPAADNSCTVGDAEAFLRALAQLKDGQTLTATPLPPNTAAAAPAAAPASKRPRRASARGALAALEAEHNQAAPAARQAAASGLDGRLFQMTVSQAAPAPAAAAAATRRLLAAAPPAELQVAAGSRRRQAHAHASGGAGSQLVDVAAGHMAESQHAQEPQERRQPPPPQQQVNSMSTVTKQGGAVSGAAGSSLPGQLPLQQAASGRVEWSVQPGALACSAEQPQHSHDQMGWTDTAAGAAAACTDVSLPKLRVTAERLDTSAQPASIARQPSGAMVSAAADASASVSVRAEDGSVATSTGSDDEGTEVERSRPGSPTASEAALLGVLMLQQGSAEALQADIMSAFGASAPGSSQVSGGSGGGDAAGTSTAHPPRARRVAVASGKRKGGMPAVCPCCGQLPLSEEDKRAASKRGRRKKADESDPRNRKAELSREFLMAHLVEARLSLRDVCFYHGHCATTVSRVARNLGMVMPSSRLERKPEAGSQPPPLAAVVSPVPAAHALSLPGPLEDLATDGSGSMTVVQEVSAAGVWGAAAAAAADAMAKEALQALDAAAPKHVAAPGVPTVLVQQQGQEQQQQQQQGQQLEQQRLNEQQAQQQRQLLVAALAKVAGSASGVSSAIAAAIEAARQAADFQPHDARAVTPPVADAAATVAAVAQLAPASRLSPLPPSDPGPAADSARVQVQALQWPSLTAAAPVQPAMRPAPQCTAAPGLPPLPPSLAARMAEKAMEVQAAQTASAAETPLCSGGSAATTAACLSSVGRPASNPRAARQ